MNRVGKKLMKLIFISFFPISFVFAPAMSDRKADDVYHTFHHDDPSLTNLWSAYLSKSEKYDRTMAQNWKGDMDAILIFAGLFSASLTAFIVESYKTLIPDPNDTTILLLSRISQQLASVSNTSGLSTLSIPSQDAFSPPISASICNILWFLSLGFSLICALSATLVEQWTRRYLQASSNRPAPQDRARLSAYLYQGIKKYKMAAIVETIPMLLHISLFLFFAGLVAFLIPINPGLAYLILAMLFCCCSLYISISIIPIFQLSCPYWTPLSTLFWDLLRRLHLLRRLDADGNVAELVGRMSEAREVDAMDVTPERDERDLKAMCWTINALRKDSEFEGFVETLPPVISGMDYSAKRLVDDLARHKDFSVSLGYRIPKLLTSCNPVHLSTSIAHKRAVSCLKAIWSLAMLSIPKPSSTKLTHFRRNLLFKEDTLDLLYNAGRNVPSVAEYILSASVIVARSLMDMQIDRAQALEEEILRILETGQRGSFTIDGYHIPLNQKTSADFIGASEYRSQVLIGYLSQFRSLLTPLPHVMLEDMATQHLRLLAASKSAPFIDIGTVSENLKLVKGYQIILNQAGFNLALEYTGKILSSDTVPHEAFNTLRRVFFRINFQMQVSQESQERLVNYLEEAVEQTVSQLTGLPKGITDILIKLTRVLTEPNSILKAICVIDKYQKTTRDDGASNAITNLEQVLPRDTRGPPPLDLFTSHVYAEAKPVRQQSSSRTKASPGGLGRT